MRESAFSFCALVVVCAAAIVSSSCSKGAATTSTPAAEATGAAAARGGRAAGGRAGGGPVPVTVTTVVQKPMAVNVRAVGNVEPASTVSIRAQVTGALETVNFKEGDDVEAGQLLFTLDPRPFELAVRQAEVTLARDTSQWKNADNQLTRSVEMLAQGLVAPATHEATLATANALKGALATDQVNIDNAKLQLQYTKIVSPVSGRTGALLVHTGSLVRNNDSTPLVVINQVSPVFVAFSVPARLLEQVRTTHGHQGLKVMAVPAGSTAAPIPGVVTFMDNAVDVTSDTIRLKASFPNTDRRLWPGAFVDVTLRLSENQAALVVPNGAVQPSQQGPFVYVTKPDQTVEARPVTVAWIEGNETVVASGLAAGETIVVDGQLRLTPGARITTGGGRGGQGQAPQRGQ